MSGVPFLSGSDTYYLVDNIFFVHDDHTQSKDSTPFESQINTRFPIYKRELSLLYPQKHHHLNATAISHTFIPITHLNTSLEPWKPHITSHECTHSKPENAAPIHAPAPIQSYNSAIARCVSVASRSY